MSVSSTRTLVVRATCALATLATLATACNVFALDGAQTPVQALQALGTQIKLASDQADASRTPTAASLSGFE
ncbi:MAG: hypothetical protein P4L92_15675 [Rudaea sp.]|nr:hypothetical protein [Rudaea sp.]